VPVTVVEMIACPRRAGEDKERDDIVLRAEIRTHKRLIHIQEPAMKAVERAYPPPSALRRRLEIGFRSSNGLAGPKALCWRRGTLANVDGSPGPTSLVGLAASPRGTRLRRNVKNV
jgi:hypothetical protein